MKEKPQVPCPCQLRLWISLVFKTNKLLKEQINEAFNFKNEQAAQDKLKKGTQSKIKCPFSFIFTKTTITSSP